MQDIERKWIYMEMISETLQQNTEYIEKLFENAMDFTERKFTVCGTNAVLFSLAGMVDKQNLSLSVVNPIMTAAILELDGTEKMKFLENEVLGTVEQGRVTRMDEIIERLMMGFAVLLMDGCTFGLAFGVQGFSTRGIQEPDNETMQRGSREGFVESYHANITLIRRRMKNTNLKFEKMYMGSESRTPVILCYLQNVVSQKILRQLKNELYACDLKTVMAAGYLAGYLKKSSVFGNVGLTERPDTVCGKITEGRIAILVDGTPTAIVVPYLFVENFQALDDYANRPFYATFTRWIRYVAFWVAIFAPGFYAAITVHRPEVLPDSLLIKIAMEEANTPFSILWELLLVNLLYEIMKEAGLRAPKTLSQSVSIVGALVIGDTAVKSGLIGAPSLMMIALAAIASYAVPKLYEQLSVLRFLMILVGGLAGPWGLVLAGLFLVYNISSEERYGIPITSPLSPFQWKAMRDVLVRAPWRVLSRYTQNVQTMPGTEE